MFLCQLYNGNNLVFCSPLCVTGDVVAQTGCKHSSTGKDSRNKYGEIKFRVPTQNNVIGRFPNAKYFLNIQRIRFCK